jgi:diaminohydroxyphosphoribosylaminopyrimidine deaminase / 5-amino-6-(5-phosphoribosylamino)uracil reductase
MATQIELSTMRRAIALSALGLGTCSPNPPVGCVILDSQGHIVGQGYHQRKGEPHAEAHALAAAAGRAENGTAIVTLEPCNHHGRTPPCHQALIDAGIARVVIALIDPTSRGEGGAVTLRAAGVDVEIGVLAGEARLVLGPWLDSLQSHRPHVTWAYILSDDALTPALESSSRPVAEDAQLLRIQADVVLCSEGEIEEGAWDSHGTGILQLSSSSLTERPPSLLASLHAGGVRLVLLSGDLTFAKPFVQAGLVDRIVLYSSTEGSSTSPRSSGDADWSFLPPGFKIVNIARLGSHVKTTAIQTGKQA